MAFGTNSLGPGRIRKVLYVRSALFIVAAAYGISGDLGFYRWFAEDAGVGLVGVGRPSP